LAAKENEPEPPILVLSTFPDVLERRYIRRHPGALRSKVSGRFSVGQRYWGTSVSDSIRGGAKGGMNLCPDDRRLLYNPGAPQQNQCLRALIVRLPSRKVRLSARLAGARRPRRRNYRPLTPVSR
jgi:hypothetical protein